MANYTIEKLKDAAGNNFSFRDTSKYTKPSGGIPKSDLASAVQTSLGKADSALQSHQSLDGYVNNIQADSTTTFGNESTIVVGKSGKNLLTRTALSLYNYIKGKLDSVYAAFNHTHSVKINGSTKTIAASGGTSVDLGTYLTSHQDISGKANTDGSNATGTWPTAGMVNATSALGGLANEFSSSNSHYFLMADVEYRGSATSSWKNYADVFAISSRHNGAGILIVSAGVNTSTPSKVGDMVCRLDYIGSNDHGGSRRSDEFYLYGTYVTSTVTWHVYLIAYCHDTSGLRIYNRLAKASDGNFSVKTTPVDLGTAIPSEYGSLLASQSSNVAEKLRSLNSSTYNDAYTFYSLTNNMTINVSKIKNGFVHQFITDSSARTVTLNNDTSNTISYYHDSTSTQLNAGTSFPVTVPSGSLLTFAKHGNNVYCHTSLSVTGSNASGISWPISVTGNAATATTAKDYDSSSGTIKTALNGKADKKVPSAANNVALLDSNGNLADSGKTLGKSVPSNAVFTDTKNTAGSSNSTAKLFLIGSNTQGSSPQTYSNSKLYSDNNFLTLDGPESVDIEFLIIQNGVSKVSLTAGSGNVNRGVYDEQGGAWLAWSDASNIARLGKNTSNEVYLGKVKLNFSGTVGTDNNTIYFA